uniref:unspecific monooxygenase n=1 Tax=Pseudonaja textilis TaxID=8673 RepID=A0A670YGU8_PSETE
MSFHPLLLVLPDYPALIFFCFYCVCVFFFSYGIWPYNFFKKLGIPGPRPLPFIGTFHKYRNGVLKFDQRCYETYGKIWGIFDGRQPVMAILDPALIKTILVKEFYTYFTNRRDFGLNGNLDTAITVVVDDQWKKIRSALSPTFTSGRLKEVREDLAKTLLGPVCFP